jgi:hypothetical protein
MRPFYASLALLSALCACGGAAQQTPSPIICNDAVDSAVIPKPPSMLYPVDGATGVNDGNFTLVLQYGDGNNVGIESANSGGVIYLNQAPVPNPFPSPATTPAPGTAPAGYAVPALSRATTYTVVEAVHEGCGQSFGLSFVKLGTFTTR